jgi:DNA-binding transcriptional regulator YiaG
MPETQMSGEQFRAIRRRSGLTQVEFARQLGYHKMTISKHERGVSTIPRRLGLMVLALFGQARKVQSKKPRTSRVVRSRR